MGKAHAQHVSPSGGGGQPDSFAPRAIDVNRSPLRSGSQSRQRRRTVGHLITAAWGFGSGLFAAALALPVAERAALLGPITLGFLGIALAGGVLVAGTLARFLRR